MLDYLKKLIENQKNKKDKSNDKGKNIYKSLERNHSYLKNLFKDCDDINFRKFKIAGTQTSALVVFVDGLSDRDTLSNNVIRMLTTMAKEEATKKIDAKAVEDRLISVSKVSVVQDYDQAIEDLLSGEGLLLVDGVNCGFVLEARQWESRAVSEPLNEQVVRGPREGFVETLRFNTAMIRRRIKNNDLKMKHFKIGRQTKTDVAVIYMSNIAKQELIDEVKERLEQIDIDGILDSNYIEELIEERTISPFPQMLNTERPDKAVAHLLEGKVIVVIDGSPNALVLPVTISDFFQSAEDHYNRYIVATLTRFLRLFAFFASTSLTALYVILTTFRYEVLPERIIFSIAENRRQLPFSPFVEALLLEFLIEFLREATIRIPGPFGQTIGIVGALIIGQAAIDANLVGPILVVITATSMLGSFAIPAYNMSSAVRVMRFPILIASGIYGGFGFVLMWMVILIHLCNLESFGVPFLQPLFPFKASEQRDNIYRAPRRWLRRRPIETAGNNVRRQRGVENGEEKKE